VGFGSLWIPSCGDHTVVRVDTETGTPQTTNTETISVVTDVEEKTRNGI
jgi:hypothetical protein